MKLIKAKATILINEGLGSIYLSHNNMDSEALCTVAGGTVNFLK